MSILLKTLAKTPKSNIIFPSTPNHLLNQYQCSLSSLYSTWSTKPFSNDHQLQSLYSMEGKQKNPTLVDEFEKKKLAKPTEIPFQVKVANWVNFIGTIKMPVQFCDDSIDGKFWAATVISPQRHPFFTSSRLWIPIMFEGDLAHTAAVHLKENEYVYIAGHLSPLSSPINLTNGKVKLQVMVHDVCYVRRYPGMTDVRP